MKAEVVQGAIKITLDGVPDDLPQDKVEGLESALMRMAMGIEHALYPPEPEPEDDLDGLES